MQCKPHFRNWLLRDDFICTKQKWAIHVFRFVLSRSHFSCPSLYVKLRVPVDDLRPESLTLGLKLGRRKPTKRTPGCRVTLAMLFNVVMAVTLRAGTPAVRVLNLPPSKEATVVSTVCSFPQPLCQVSGALVTHGHCMWQWPHFTGAGQSAHMAQERLVKCAAVPVSPTSENEKVGPVGDADGQAVPWPVQAAQRTWRPCVGRRH